MIDSDVYFVSAEIRIPIYAAHEDAAHEYFLESFAGDRPGFAGEVEFANLCVVGMADSES